MFPKHQNIKYFSFEHEGHASLSFLKPEIYCKGDKFVTTFYCNRPFSGGCTNYDKFHSNAFEKRDLSAYAVTSE